jgi:hypothetical protein
MADLDEGHPDRSEVRHALLQPGEALPEAGDDDTRSPI